MELPGSDRLTIFEFSQKRIKKSHPKNNPPPPPGRADASVDDTNFSVHLPDDVLEKIFTFLPIRNSVQLATLSTRFRNSWIYNRKLHFDMDFVRGNRSLEALILIINHVFDLHAGPSIQSFRLFIESTGREQLVQKWINICIEKGIEELDLDIVQARGPFELSPDFLDIKSLRILRLSFCKIYVPPVLKGLGLLNTLVLRRTAVPPTLIDMVLKNCLFLETLDIAICRTVAHLKIFVRHLKMFKALKVGTCPDVIWIDVDAPTLQSFHYCGDINIFRFHDASRLNDVMLHFTSAKSFTEYFQGRNLIQGLSRIEVLTTTSSFIEGLCPRFVDGAYRELQFFIWNLKEIQLFMKGAKFCSIFDIANFLKNCPFLERIFIDFSEYSFEGGPYWKLHQRQEFDELWAAFNQLKFMKLKGFRYQKYEIMLVKFILTRAKSLEKLILVGPKHGRSAKAFAEDSLVYVQLIECWTASPSAQIEVHHHDNDMSSIYPMHCRETWY